MKRLTKRAHQNKTTVHLRVPLPAKAQLTANGSPLPVQSTVTSAVSRAPLASESCSYSVAAIGNSLRDMTTGGFAPKQTI